MIRTGLFTTGVLFIAGCAVGNSGIGPATPSGELPAVPQGGTVLIANSLSETLSRLDLTTTPARMEPQVALTGQAPNALLLYGSEILVVNSLSNSVQLLDRQTLSQVAEYSLGSRTNPWDAVIVGDTAWVSCWVSQEVVGLDLTDGTIHQRIAAPTSDGLPHVPGVTTRAYPQGMAQDLNESRIYVALPNLNAQFLPAGAGVLWTLTRDGDSFQSDGITVLEPAANAADVTVSNIGGRPAVIVACAGDFEPGTGYRENGTLTWLDGVTLQVREHRLVESAPVRVTARGPWAYAPGAQTGDVVALEFGATAAPVRITLPDAGAGQNYASAVAFGDDTTLLALQFNSDRLYAIDVRTWTVSGGVTTGDGPVALLVLPRE